MSATTCRPRGLEADVPLRSEASTANPSTDELSNKGRSEETMSAASTRPAHRSSGSISVSTGLKWLRIRAWAASTLSAVISRAGALYHADSTPSFHVSKTSCRNRMSASATDAVCFCHIWYVFELCENLAQLGDIFHLNHQPQFREAAIYIHLHVGDVDPLPVEHVRDVAH